MKHKVLVNLDDDGHFQVYPITERKAIIDLLNRLDEECNFVVDYDLVIPKNYRRLSTDDWLNFINEIPCERGMLELVTINL